MRFVSMFVTSFVTVFVICYELLRVHLCCRVQFKTDSMKRENVFVLAVNDCKLRAV